MTQQFLKAFVTIRFEVDVGLERPLLKFPPAVGTHETLWMEFMRHRSDDASVDPFSANVTLVFRFRIFCQLHLLEESSAKHFRHILFFERLPKFAQTSGQICSSVTQLNIL